MKKGVRRHHCLRTPCNLRYVLCVSLMMNVREYKLLPGRLLLPLVFMSAVVPYSWSSSPGYIALADSADNYIKRERWDDAEQTLLRALRLEPGNFANSLLLSNLGVVRTNQGRYDQALEDFRLGLSIAPNSSVIRRNRARTYMLMSKYDEALGDLDRVLESDSLQEWSLQMRGNILLGYGRLEEAEGDFSKLLKLYPRNASALNGMARVAGQRGDLRTAIDYYNSAIDIDDNPDARFGRILLKLNGGMYDDASEDLSESIKRYPEAGDLYLLRAYLHKLRFRNSDAEMDLKIALDKGADPSLAEMFFPGSSNR